MSRKPASSALYGIAGLFLFLLALFFIPPLLERHSYEIQFPKSNAGERKPFPVERELPVLKGSKLLQGKTKSKMSLKEIATLTNSTLLVNFWATWCPPCVEEFPSLEFLHRQLLQTSGSKKTPLIVTISVDDRAEDINRFYKTLDFEPSMIVLHDVDGDMARGVGTVKFPETYWVDAQGKNLYKWVGPQAWLSREVIERLMTPAS